MSPRSRGFTIMETIVAALILVYVAGTFVSLYVVTSRDAIHSQMLVLADITADSLLEEVEGHLFGLPPQENWGIRKAGAGDWQTVSYDIWLDGRQVKTEFHIQWNLKNGSFIGTSAHNQDMVTIVVSWREGEGEDPDYGEFSKVYFQGDTRHVVVQVPVWR